MSLRRCTGVIAILGVLLHALAIVRHHAVTLPGLWSAEDALQSDRVLAFGALPICRGNPAALARGSDATGDSPARSPSKSKQGSPCPVCSGGLSGYALASSATTVALLPDTGAIGLPAPPDHERDAARGVRPPARGPPAPA